MDILRHPTLPSDLSNTKAKRRSRSLTNHSRRDTRSLFGEEITPETLTRTARLRYVLRRGYISHLLRPLGIQARLCTLRSRHRPKRTVRRLLEQSSERSSESPNKVRRMSPSRKCARQDSHGLGSFGRPQSKHAYVHQREAEWKSLGKAKVISEVEIPPQYELILAGRFACFGTIYGWRARWNFIGIDSKSSLFFLPFSR